MPAIRHLGPIQYDGRRTDGTRHHVFRPCTDHVTCQTKYPRPAHATLSDPRYPADRHMNPVDPNRFNPLLRDAHARQVLELMKVFPPLRTAADPQFVSLWKYLDACPQRFFSAEAYETYLDSLLQLYASRKEELLRLLHDQRGHLDKRVSTRRRDLRPGLARRKDSRSG